MAQLFEYSPLMVRGRPLLGGLPTRTKSPGSFVQRFVNGKLEWWKEGQKARSLRKIEQEIANNPDLYPSFAEELLRQDPTLGDDE